MKETYRDNAQDPEMKVYNPWGKGGAGAPVLDQSGNPRQNVFGKMQSEVRCEPLIMVMTMMRMRRNSRLYIVLLLLI